MDALSDTTTEPYTLPSLTPQNMVLSDRSLRVVLGRTKLSLDELGSLRSEQVVTLQDAVDSPVDVVCGNRVVARAVPIQRDGELALRVTELMNNVESEEEVIS